MASRQELVDYFCDQMSGAGEVTYKKMFGEYGLYYAGKNVALVCDDQLFFKPTAGGRAVLGEPVMAPPYKGAKDCFLIEDAEDRELLARLTEATAAELPSPKPRKNTAR